MPIAAIKCGGRLMRRVFALFLAASLFHSSAWSRSTGGFTNVSAPGAAGGFTCSRCQRSLFKCKRCGKFHHRSGKKQNAFPSVSGPNSLASAGGGNSFPSQSIFGDGGLANGGFGNAHFDNTGIGSAGLGSGGFGPTLQPQSPSRDLASFGRPQDDIHLPTQQDLASATPQGLIKAGTNGNPGWSYAVPLGGGSSSLCQATLISSKEGFCSAATAEHCVNEFSDGKEFTVDTPDFGRIKATLAKSGNSNRDWAVFGWHCGEVPDNVPVVPVSTQEPYEGEQLYYGKVMGGKAGIYPGRPWNEPGVSGVNGEPIGTSVQQVVQNAEVAIQQGDSGGGLYRKLADGSYELVGVLSTSDDVQKKRPIGSYAVKESIKDLIRKVGNWI